MNRENIDAAKQYIWSVAKQAEDSGKFSPELQDAEKLYDYVRAEFCLDEHETQTVFMELMKENAGHIPQEIREAIQRHVDAQYMSYFIQHALSLCKYSPCIFEDILIMLSRMKLRFDLTPAEAKAIPPAQDFINAIKKCATELRPHALAYVQASDAIDRQHPRSQR